MHCGEFEGASVDALLKHHQKIWPDGGGFSFHLAAVIGFFSNNIAYPVDSESSHHALILIIVRIARRVAGMRGSDQNFNARGKDAEHPSLSRTLPSPRYRASRLDIHIERTSSKLLLQGDPCLAHFGLNDPSNIYGAGEQSPATNDAAPSTKQVSKGEKISTEIMYDNKVSRTMCSISMICPTRHRRSRNH